MLEIDKKTIEELRKEVGYTFDSSRMKDTMGRFWTQGLFKEMSYGRGRDCIMTFKNKDFENLVSFKRVFVEIGDPSGYTAAMVLLNSWDHWLKLCDNSQFLKELKKAEDELAVKLKSKAFIEIKEISQGTSGSALSAAKYIANGSFKEINSSNIKGNQPKNTVRPKEQDKEKKIVSIVRKETNKDYIRLGLGKENNER